MTRPQILALVALAQLALGQRALAQAQPDPGAGEGAGADEAGAEGEGESLVLPPEGTAPAAAAGQGAVPPPDTYTVRPGDTLWDLSGRFLNNPWYWPKVWSFNPEITNPHWIDPGQLLRFYPSAEEVPTRVEPVAGAEEVAPEPEVEAP